VSNQPVHLIQLLVQVHLLQALVIISQSVQTSILQAMQQQLTKAAVKQKQQ
jgi:hypothetical protein